MSNLAGRSASVPARTTGFGIAGLILGIVGIFLGQVLLGPLAIIFGGIGWYRANRGDRGKALSITGVVLGIVDLVIFAIVVTATSRNGGPVWRL
jgi:hypothetical protein